ncbi:MAG: DUF2029 domain-containing protein, partial [Deltaproteobacteria bacterium]|nr:DUF2029 domain-containing protein [Deltaproteobacteria bacterium]
MEFQFKRYIELQDRPAHSYSNIPVVRLRQLLDNRTAVALLCIIATGWALIVIWQLRLSPQTTDFSHYYTGALLMREGTNPYTTDLSPIAARMHMNLNGNTRATYPPTFELLFAQLTRLPPKQAFWLWTVFNIGLLALIIRWLTEQLRECNPRIATAAIALAILYPPLTIHLKEAQTQILVCFLLVAMIRGLQRGHGVIAGLAVSAAILLRIYPATMAGYSLARRRWLLFGSLCFGVAVGGAITCACVGIGRSLSFIQSVPLIKSPLFFRAGDNIAIE